jgi:hypothetical protein
MRISKISDAVGMEIGGVCLARNLLDRTEKRKAMEPFKFIAISLWAA